MGQSMRTPAAPETSLYQTKSMGVATGKFLSELTELSNKYGLGITGQPLLFVMEEADRQFAYRIDTESNLSLG